MSYIKLDRKLINWEWKDVPEMVALWVEILLQANYQENKWRGETYEKGSFPTSLDKLAKNTGLSVKKIRTCLKRLEESGEIGTQRANKGTKIIVINWELYQGSDSNDDDNWANKGQTKGKQRATLKEIKNIRNKEYIERNIKERKFTPPTYDEVKQYCLERNNGVDAERFIDFYTSKDWFIGKSKMKDWKACVRTWERNKPKEEIVVDKSEIIPIYDNSQNPQFSDERKQRLLERRKNEN